jgi:hypothetical protein
VSSTCRGLGTTLLLALVFVPMLHGSHGPSQIPEKGNHVSEKGMARAGKRGRDVTFDYYLRARFTADVAGWRGWGPCLRYAAKSSISPNDIGTWDVLWHG